MSNSYDPMDCGPPGSSVHGISQTRILDCIAIFFSRGSSWPRDQPTSPAFQADSFPLSHQGVSEDINQLHLSQASGTARVPLLHKLLPHLVTGSCLIQQFVFLLKYYFSNFNQWICVISIPPNNPQGQDMSTPRLWKAMLLFAFT